VEKTFALHIRTVSTEEDATGCKDIEHMIHPNQQNTFVFATFVLSGVGDRSTLQTLDRSEKNAQEAEHSFRYVLLRVNFSCQVQLFLKFLVRGQELVHLI